MKHKISVNNVHLGKTKIRAHIIIGNKFTHMLSILIFHNLSDYIVKIKQQTYFENFELNRNRTIVYKINNITQFF